MKKVKILALTAIPAIVVATALFFTGYLYIQSKEPVPNLPATQTVQAPTTVPLNADTIFNLVNQERIKAGVKPLIRDARLDQTAQARADDMATRNYEGHFDPTTGKNMVEIVHEQNTGLCSYAGENIVKVTRKVLDYNKIAVQSWLDSPVHKSFMLDDRYETTGVAIKGDRIIQHFCDLK